MFTIVYGVASLFVYLPTTLPKEKRWATLLTKRTLFQRFTTRHGNFDQRLIHKFESLYHSFRKKSRKNADSIS